jgi:hypothetical protein
LLTRGEVLAIEFDKSDKRLPFAGRVSDGI